MSPSGELDSILSKLKNFNIKHYSNADDLLNFLKDFDVLLVTSEGISLLKQPNRNFEIVLPVFTNIIYCDDLRVAKYFFKYFEVVTDIFRSKLPKIKKGEWWKKFELDHLVKSIPKLTQKISPSDGSWVEIWSFTANLIISDTALSTVPLNTLLSISETSFRKGKEQPEILDQAWRCWVALIDAFGRSPKILLPSKTLNLLMKPLLACYSVSKLRITTWIHLIEVKGITSTDDTVRQLVVSFCKAMYNVPGDKAINRHLPEDCAEALLKLLSYSQAVEKYLDEVVSVFGACLRSRPAIGIIEKLAYALIKAVNECENEAFSFKQWKSLVEQYKSSNESPITSQACEVFFTEVNFQRWVDSGTIDSKDLIELISCSEFRSKVLLRSITLPSITEDENTPKKRSKKGSPETVWNNYCEAYMSWWSNQSPPSTKANDRNSPEFPAPSRDGRDYHAMLALLLYPIQLNSWCPAISKTWAKMCETCNKHRLLQLMIKQIVDALEEPNLQIQKAIDVLNILFGIDPNFCKACIKILEALVPKVYSMEPKHIMELLNLCEIAVACVELSSVITKIMKNITEVASSESDQLNAHKIRTKVGKLSRKIEQLSYSSERDKPAKTQRTPFRTQSNFLQRLAKAEEKNKTKNTFLSSIFSPSEKNKNDESGESENGISELPSLDTSLDNINSKISDEPGPKKSLKLLDDSENVPIMMPLMSPTILKESLSSVNEENKDREATVAEKENVIQPTSTASPTVPSPANKMKITNARELKIVDSSSPTMIKKAKPLAGQKVTPKKVTPSKVISYFDDDANDCVMVPPKPKTTLLTEHQMEMMTKRRTDIPAMYQDLSQDTQISNPPSAIVQEISGLSPQETEDIVNGTPSPTTPERPKTIVQLSSAEELDFNSIVSTPPKQLEPTVSLDDPSLKTSSDRDIHPKEDSSNTTVEKSIDSRTNDSKDLPVENGFADHEEKNDSIPLTDKNCLNVLEQDKHQPEVADPSSITPKKENQNSVGEEKTKRKRKSEPIRFSPKQTRSKKILKSVTPDAKLSKSLTNESSSKVSNDRSVSKEVSETVKSETIASSASLVNAFVEDDERKCSDDPIVSEIHVAVVDVNPPGSQISSEVTEDKSSRKRKCEDVSSADGPKKSKPCDEGTPTKKAGPLKKKKKLFKLNSGNNNLENWLVKTERIPNANSPSPCSIKSEGVNSEEIMNSEPLVLGPLPANEDSAIDLNNSEEIVPCTQEMETSSLLDAAKSISFCKIKDEYQEQVEKSDKNSVDVVAKEVNVNERPQDACDVDEMISETPSGHQNSNSASPEKSINCESVLQKLAEDSPNDDDVDLIICSPTKRHRRASSVLRGEGDTYLTKEKFLSEGSEEGEPQPAECSLRNRGRTSSPSTHSKKRIYPPGGRSARMLRLAASSTLQEEESGFVTPTRKRENIVPMTYGENWPKGPTEDWVACIPLSPYASPFKSVLKRMPLSGDECQVTPQRCPAESLASPLLSSAKRKRVVFLDPPVTKGLIYERDSPFGAVHLADIPQGSPYPTWKGDENTTSILTPQSKPETTSVNANTSIENHVDLTTPSIQEDVHELIEESSTIDKTPIDRTESTAIPSSELEYNEFRDKYRLDDDFINQLSQLSLHIRGLVTQCFESCDMEETVDGWQLGNCRKICELPHTFLSLVKNEREQSLIEILKAVNLIPVVFEVPAVATGESQTDPTNVPITHSGCQTELETRAMETNTVAPNTSSRSTQADQELPSPAEVLPILVRLGSRKTLEYCSEYLRILSSIQDAEK